MKSPSLICIFLSSFIICGYSTQLFASNLTHGDNSHSQKEKRERRKARREKARREASEKFVPNFSNTSGSPKVKEIAEAAFNSGACKKMHEKCKDGNCKTDQISKAFLVGMANTFARTVCGRKTENSSEGGALKKLLSSAPGMHSTKDVLTVHGYGNGLGSKVGVANISRTYAIIAALQLQESDGNLDEGVDKAKTGEDHNDLETQEGGAYQVSPNSRKLFKKHKAANDAYKELLSSYLSSLDNADDAKVEKICLAGNFTDDGKKNGKKKISIPKLIKKIQNADKRNAKNGSALKPKLFLTLQKACPAFATEYMALLARHNRKHNGPIKRGEIKHSAGCEKLFNEIAEKVESESDSENAICAKLKLNSKL